MLCLCPIPTGRKPAIHIVDAGCISRKQWAHQAFTKDPMRREVAQGMLGMQQCFSAGRCTSPIELCCVHANQCMQVNTLCLTVMQQHHSCWKSFAGADVAEIGSGPVRGRAPVSWLPLRSRLVRLTAMSPTPRIKRTLSQIGAR